MNEDQYLSIKDFAQAAGVSVQSVYKRLNQVENPLNQYLNLIDGRKMLDIKALKGLYGVEVEQPVEQPLNQSCQPNSTGDTAIKALNQQLGVLQDQLKSKDLQIEELNQRLKESMQLLDQQQKLTAIAEQKVMMLEQQEAADQEEDPKEPESKKSWWRRIFFKNKYIEL